jgi:hypothetical protein
MKKVLAFLTLAMLTIFSTAALAQKQNDNPAAFDSAWQEHRQSMAAIQDKMWAKSMEYDALVANPNAKQSDITAVINEMTELRGQMRGEYDKFAAQLGDQGYGPGKGFGYDGPGCAFGGPGMGYGPGRGYDGPGMGHGRGYGHCGGRHHRNW